MIKQTKIDNMLIEIISPKLKEIEERFSKGEGLSNEDTNTLLLKSQFNHINHLDQKLNEVTDDEASLKLDFSNLRAGVKTDMVTMSAEVQSAININMLWSIGIIAFIVIALKVIDMIWGRG